MAWKVRSQGPPAEALELSWSSHNWNDGVAGTPQCPRILCERRWR